MSQCLTCVLSQYTVNPGANLTYLAPPGQFFMGAKSFIGTPEMQRFFVLKEKLVCTMRKCMVSMATVNVILEHGGDIQNCLYLHYYLPYTTELGLL